MLTEKVKDELQKREHSKFHQDLLRHVVRLVENSRNSMSEYYPKWDFRDDVFRSRRQPDKADIRAADGGDPAKLIIPLSYAQVQTFVAFNYLLLTQNKRFYEFVPTGAEDHRLREVIELVVEKDLKRGNWPASLFQFLLDIGKFGLGVLKHSWRVEKQMLFANEVDVEAIRQDNMFEMTKWEGNKIVNISPYRFFPDTRLPLTRFQEGEFVASDDEYTKAELRRLENEGEIAGVDHIKEIEDKNVDIWTGRRLSLVARDIRREVADKMTCVTEVQIKLVPKDYENDAGEHPLGDAGFPVKFLIWMANDNRLLKVEPLDYIHDEFTYSAAQLMPDQHHVLNDSLADTVGGLQEVVDWFINSRVTSVARTLDNQVVVDPSVVDMTTLKGRNRVIQLKKGATRMGVDKAVKQLNVQDVTGNHISDAKELSAIMQLVTGVNDNALGQVASGRRSATENRAANQGAASRLKMIANLIWSTALEPLGRNLAVNHRYGLSEQQFIKIVGRESADLALYPEFRATPEELVGLCDFFVFDSTLPTEKGFIAQSLQELFVAILQVPDLAVALDLNVKELFNEIQQLRGVTNIERFSLQKQNPELIPQLLAHAARQRDNQSGPGNDQDTQGTPSLSALP